MFENIKKTYKVYAQIDCLNSHHFVFPQTQLLEQMFKNEDEVIWVMTTRNTKDWVRSVVKWDDLF